MGKKNQLPIRVRGVSLTQYISEESFGDFLSLILQQEYGTAEDKSKCQSLDVYHSNDGNGVLSFERYTTHTGYPKEKGVSVSSRKLCEFLGLTSISVASLVNKVLTFPYSLLSMAFYTFLDNNLYRCIGKVSCNRETNSLFPLIQFHNDDISLISTHYIHDRGFIKREW